MPGEFIRLLVYNIKLTWVFALIFIIWPVVFGLGSLGSSPSPDSRELRLGEALRRSFSSYMGFDKEAVHRWHLILHRIVGALAWAYVVAVFIASIG